MQQMTKKSKNHFILIIFRNFKSDTFFENPNLWVTQTPLVPLNLSPDHYILLDPWSYTMNGARKLWSRNIMEQGSSVTEILEGTTLRGKDA